MRMFISKFQKPTGPSFEEHFSCTRSEEEIRADLLSQIKLEYPDAIMVDGYAKYSMAVHVLKMLAVNSALPRPIAFCHSGTSGYVPTGVVFETQDTYNQFLAVAGNLEALSSVAGFVSSVV